MPKPKNVSPKVFISYSWDSPSHKNWVKELAEELREFSVDIILDQWDMRPGQSLTQFMESSIDRADFVLVICTPNYAQRSNARRGGVGFEQQIISGRMLLGLKNKSFIPIVRKGNFLPGKNCAVPTHLTGLFSLKMNGRGFHNDEFTQLVQALLGLPRHRPPPLRQSPLFRPKAHKAKRAKFSLRLPDLELDGYQMSSGKAQAELYPKSFEIPSERARQSVGKGDLVKITFRLWDKSDKELVGERMWVKVTSLRSCYYVGKLSNQPLTMDRNGWPLKWGDTVCFLPEHIIDIEKNAPI